MTRAWIGLMGVALALVSGCGNGGGSAQPNVSDPAGVAEESGAAPTASGPTGAAGDLARTDDFLPEDVPLPIEEGCGELYDSVMSAFDGIGSTAADETFTGFAAAYDRLRAVVPPDLVDDVEVMSTTYALMDQTLARYDYDFARISADPQAQADVAAAFADEDGTFGEAVAQVERWLAEQCPAG